MEDQRPELYANELANVLKLAIQQLIWNIGVLVLHLAGNEVVSRQDGEMIHFVKVLSSSDRYM